MSMNHLMSDFVARINNANMINKEKTQVLKNKLSLEVCRKLTSLGYIAGFEDGEREIEVTLKPGKIRKIKVVSKPGLRQYAKPDSIPKIVGGIGYTILTTSSGLLTQVEANKQNVGGEILFQIY